MIKNGAFLSASTVQYECKNVNSVRSKTAHKKMLNSQNTLSAVQGEGLGMAWLRTWIQYSGNKVVTAQPPKNEHKKLSVPGSSSVAESTVYFLTRNHLVRLAR